jgi:hypothetical protein
MASSARSRRTNASGGSSWARIARVALLSAACRVPTDPQSPASAHSEGRALAEGQVVSFAFDSLDARAVSSQVGQGQGRKVVLAFVTTWDITSQAQASILAKMELDPSVFTALVVLDDRANRELVEQYAKTLNVTFPVAMAAPTGSEAGTPTYGDFGAVAVPVVVVLDTLGRGVFRSVGLAKPAQIRAALDAAK